MSKKFLTVFALVALLVAAMAGTAFAAPGDVATLTRSDDVRNNVGEFTVDSAAPAYTLDAYYMSGDVAPEVIVSFTAAITDPAAAAFISTDVTNGTVAIDALDNVNGETTVEVTFSITGWDPTTDIVLENIGTYAAAAGNAKIGNAAGKLTITPVELVVSADTAETITLTEGVTATPANAEFTLYEKGQTTPFDGDSALAHIGEKLFVNGAAMEDDIVNKSDVPGDFVSADLVATGEVKFVVGSFGPGSIATKKLGYGITGISFDISGGDEVYVAGVNAAKALAEVSVDIVAGALKTTGDIEFTLKEASDPKTVKVSSDQVLSVVEFWVVSDDNTFEKIDSGDVVKSLTFTFDDVAANSVDFVVAFDELYEGVSHDVTVVASSDKGKTTFLAKINDPAEGGGPTYDSDSGCDAGFGAFALLGLAGAAALLRRKD